MDDIQNNEPALLDALGWNPIDPAKFLNDAQDYYQVGQGAPDQTPNPQELGAQPDFFTGLWNKIKAWLGIAAVLALVFYPSEARAQGQTQGVALVGSTTTGIRPMAVGGPDSSGNNHFVVITPNGGFSVDFNNPKTLNVAVVNSGTAVEIAGIDSSTTIRALQTNTDGTLLSWGGVPSPLDASVAAVVTSSGVNYVRVGPAASGTTIVYATKLMVSNLDTVTHTVTIRSSGTQQLLPSFQLAAGGAFVLDNERGAFRSGPGETIQFNIDSAGSGTSVQVGGSFVQK